MGTPRTANTIEFYRQSVRDPKDIFVGGTGVTLLPDYLRNRCPGCAIIKGPLDVPGRLGTGTPPIASLVPDYSLLKRVDWEDYLRDAFFVRITKGCIRTCKFCAVPLLEKEFGRLSPLRQQLAEAREPHGEKQHLVVRGNNRLGIEGIEDIIREIRDLGVEKGAKRNGRNAPWTSTKAWTPG